MNKKKYSTVIDTDQVKLETTNFKFSDWKPLTISKTSSDLGFTSAINMASNSLYLNPASNTVVINTDSSNSASNELNQGEINELRVGVANIVKTLSEDNEISSDGKFADKPIRKAADELNIYWGNIRKIYSWRNYLQICSFKVG